jgi:hypothetical protein
MNDKKELMRENGKKKGNQFFGKAIQKGNEMMKYILFVS